MAVLVMKVHILTIVCFQTGGWLVVLIQTLFYLEVYLQAESLFWNP